MSALFFSYERMSALFIFSMTEFPLHFFVQKIFKFFSTFSDTFLCMPFCAWFKCFPNGSNVWSSLWCIKVNHHNGKIAWKKACMIKNIAFTFALMHFITSIFVNLNFLKQFWLANNVNCTVTVAKIEYYYYYHDKWWFKCNQK